MQLGSQIKDKHETFCWARNLIWRNIQLMTIILFLALDERQGIPALPFSFSDMIWYQSRYKSWYTLISMSEQQSGHLEMVLQIKLLKW